jgi:hypothetical protein
MKFPSTFRRILLVTLPCLAGLTQPAVAASVPPQNASSAKQSSTKGTNASQEPAGIPRGKKLVLKDGSYQLIRNYEIQGDRVRYYSLERDDWEEIPASMVDWDATKKAEAAEDKSNAAILEKAKIQEAEASMEPPLEVDASLPIAPGIFLPEGEGMFALEGKTIKRIAQAGSAMETDKKTVLKQVLSPIPIIPSKHNLDLPGARAAVRLTSAEPEFYLREVQTDPERDSALERTGRQSVSGPEVALMRAKIKGNKRVLESIRSFFGQEVSQERDEIAIQRWEVAPDVYRFTLSTPLPPGEYALAEILSDGINLFVWDFGVDAAPANKTASH